MTLTFDQAFDRLIGHEGGYVNDPKDPGGETKFGISKRSYPDLDIKNLTLEQAKAIYLRDYWNAIGPDAHPAIRFQGFDFAVNSGPGTAIRKLQLAIGVADDGHFGPASRKALADMDVSDVLMRYNAQRLLYLTATSNWGTYGKGWARRVAQNLLYGAEDN